MEKNYIIGNSKVVEYDAQTFIKNAVTLSFHTYNNYSFFNNEAIVTSFQRRVNEILYRNNIKAIDCSFDKDCMNITIFINKHTSKTKLINIIKKETNDLFIKKYADKCPKYDSTHSIWNDNVI